MIPKLGEVYVVEDKDTGQLLAQFRLGNVSEGMRCMVRWFGVGEWEEDSDGLELVMFPDEHSVRVRRLNA